MNYGRQRWNRRRELHIRSVRLDKVVCHNLPYGGKTNNSTYSQVDTHKSVFLVDAQSYRHTVYEQTQ